MTKEQKKMRLAKAKHTRFGRFICRLFGDEAGQALMEYVVLGVLVVAAVVALVSLFGENIGYNFRIMMYSLMGDQAKVEELKKEQLEKTKEKEKKAEDFREHISENAGEEG